jgi:hypothetical protein
MTTKLPRRPRRVMDLCAQEAEVCITSDDDRWLDFIFRLASCLRAGACRGELNCGGDYHHSRVMWQAIEHLCHRLIAKLARCLVARSFEELLWRHRQTSFLNSSHHHVFWVSSG